MVKTLCSTPSEILLFPTNTTNIQNRLLEFMNKVVYADLTMKSTSESMNQEKKQNPDESDLTIIAESFNNIHRVSLVMYIENKIQNVYVLDPAKSRPNLVFKSLNSQLTMFENKVQDKKMAFIDYSSLNLLFPGSFPYGLDAQPTLMHVLNNLIPRIKPDESKTENMNDAKLLENEDEY
jgi:hypothetical protein